MSSKCFIITLFVISPQNWPLSSTSTFKGPNFLKILRTTSTDWFAPTTIGDFYFIWYIIYLFYILDGFSFDCLVGNKEKKKEGKKDKLLWFLVYLSKNLGNNFAQQAAMWIKGPSFPRLNPELTERTRQKHFMKSVWNPSILLMT